MEHNYIEDLLFFKKMQLKILFLLQIGILKTTSK